VHVLTLLFLLSTTTTLYVTICAVNWENDIVTEPYCCRRIWHPKPPRSCLTTCKTTSQSHLDLKTVATLAR
jgi:hypothetical protein